MKGIILAGGKGTRLHPLTQTTNKHLLPVYDKPMLYYPVSLLMLGGVKEFLIISDEESLEGIKPLFNDGSQFGLKIEYAVQEKPTGIPEAFIIGEDFIQDDNVILMLGDNFLYGGIDFYKNAIQKQLSNQGSAQVFGYYVSNPTSYGVIEYDEKSHKVLSIEEKPKEPKSNYAIPGIYIFDSTVVEKAKNCKPSARGETEIIDIINQYWKEDKLNAELITRGVAWMDMGSPERLLEVSSYVSVIEKRQGLKIACLEEIAFRMGTITLNDFNNLIEEMPNSDYKNYLIKIRELSDKK